MVNAAIFILQRYLVYSTGKYLRANPKAELGLALNLPWALTMLPIALSNCHTVLIVPEEQYLTAKFGAEYRRYIVAVQRPVACNNPAKLIFLC